MGTKVKKKKVNNKAIQYDPLMECYVLHYKNEIICLGADNLETAKNEAQLWIDNVGIQL